MQKIILLFSFISFTTFSTCRFNCPPDEKKGDIELTDNTLAFLPYTGSESIILTNAQGDEITLSSIDGMINSTNKLCYKTTCEELRYGSPSSCEYYDSEAIQLNFSNAIDTILLAVTLHSAYLRKDEPMFYDVFQLSLSAGNYIGLGRINTDFRGNSTQSSDYIETDRIMTPNADWHNFNNVFKAIDGDLIFYWNKELGFLGYQTPSKEWWLDRVE